MWLIRVKRDDWRYSNPWTSLILLYKYLKLIQLQNQLPPLFLWWDFWFLDEKNNPPSHSTQITNREFKIQIFFLCSLLKSSTTSSTKRQCVYICKSQQNQKSETTKILHISSHPASHRVYTTRITCIQKKLLFIFLE